MKPSAKPSNVRAVIELVFAAVLWGFGFIAAVWALRDMAPFTLSAVRFGLAIVFGLPLVALLPSLKKDLRWEQAKLACLPGLFLALVLLLQTWGQRYTTATKSSFITTLYVLFVPIIERAVLKTKLHPAHFIFVGAGLLGTALMCQFHGGALNFGDTLTLACSLVASVHIFWFALISERIRSPITFNYWQCVWAFVFTLPFVLFEDSRLLPVSPFAWAGLASLVFGSTLIAFALQVRAQTVLSPSVASFLYLLESPFATLFAFALLNERLNIDQWIGGALILGSVAFSTYVSSRR